MQMSPFNAELRNGVPVLIRPVTPADRPLLEMGFAHLSDRSRYFRFLRPVERLSDDDLDRLVDTDGPDHLAIGALDLSGSEREPIGIARCIRLPHDPTSAEFAVTVIDSHQGLGLGSLLVGTLAASAVKAGVTGFVALVHAANAPMLQILRELGAAIEQRHGTGRELRLELQRDPAMYPATPTGDAVREAYQLVGKDGSESRSGRS